MYSRTGTINYTAQFGFLLAAFGFGIVLSYILLFPLIAWFLNVPIEGIAAALKLPQNANVSKIMQAVGSLLTLALPALLFASITWKRPLS